MKKIILIASVAILGLSVSAQSCCSKTSKAKSTSDSQYMASTVSTTPTTQTVSSTTAELKKKDVKEVFVVYGNCGMCERTIEGSLANVKGVSKADWDKETDQMTVRFDPEKISLDDIKQKIADVGYDSDTHRAKDEVYDALAGCCQYDRPSK